MRTINSLADVQIVLRDLLNWKSAQQTKNQDLHGLRITNAGDGVDPGDYATLRQVQSSSQSSQNVDQFYTIVWATNSLITGQLVPAWETGKGRDGLPHEVWLKCRTAPSGGDLEVQFTIDGTNLLSSPITIPNGGTTKVFSSSFVSPVPKVGEHSEILPVIVNNAGAGVISFGLVVKRSS